MHAIGIPHLLRIPALGRLDIPVAGGPSTLSPSSASARSGGFSASWRMVVELGPEIRAWDTYPGGQSANPASPHYADRVAQWAAGGLDAVFLPHAAAEFGPAHPAKRLTLAPAGR